MLSTMFMLIGMSSAIVLNSRFYNYSSAIVQSPEDAEDFEAYPPRSGREGHFQPEQRQFQGDQNLCPGRTMCSLLSDCRLLTDLMDRSCLLPGRLKELTCGYIRNELMVCCPVGGNSSPFKPGGAVNDDDPDHQGGSGLNQKCGRPQLNGWQNGYNGLGSQPWVVRIGFKNSDTGSLEYPCCGSLITSTVVLTAAHCALAKSTGRTISSVRVGEYDTRTDPDCTTTFCGHLVQNIPVSTVVVHPGYEKSNFRHDIALINLKTPANFSLSVQPICLLESSSVRLVDMKALLVGFGRLPGEDVVGPQQHQLLLPIQLNTMCSRVYDQVIKITKNHLCVGGEENKDACSGFGGAPLVIVDPFKQDRYMQVGFVSFGTDKCGTRGVPSVYTSIVEYYSWIRANIQ